MICPVPSTMIRSPPLTCVDYESLLPLPLAEAQRRTGVRPADEVHHYGIPAKGALLEEIGESKHRFIGAWARKFDRFREGIDGLVGVADVIGRVVTAFFEIHLHRWGLALEAAMYAGLGHLWLSAGGSFAMPEDLEGKAVTMLGFLAVLSVRSGMLVWKLMYGDERSRL